MSQSPIFADVLAFAEKAGFALQASQELAADVAAEQEKVASLLPRNADALSGVKLLSGTPLITADEKQAAAKKLASHQGALEVLHNTLEIFNEQIKQAQQTITMLQQGKGMPVATQQKQAMANSSDSPFVGARHGDDDQPESFRKFAAAMGVR